METVLFNQCGSDVVVHGKKLPSGHQLIVDLPATVYGNFAPIELSNHKFQILAAKNAKGKPVYLSTDHGLAKTTKAEPDAHTHVVQYPPAQQDAVNKSTGATVTGAVFIGSFIGVLIVMGIVFLVPILIAILLIILIVKLVRHHKT